MNERRSVLALIGRVLVGLIGVGVLTFGIFIAWVIRELADFFDGAADYAPAVPFIVAGLLILGALVITGRWGSRPAPLGRRVVPAHSTRQQPALCIHCGSPIDVHRPGCVHCGADQPVT